MSKKEAKFRSTLPLAQAVEYLQELAAALRAGTVSVANGEQSLTLKPEAQVKVELEAEQKSDRESIALSVSWRKHEVAESSSLHIGSEEQPAPDSAAEESVVEF